MANSEKTAAIAEITDKLRESGAAVLTEYRGLTVAQLSQLRSTLREHATYAVVKNTLTEIAAKEAGVNLKRVIITSGHSADRLHEEFDDSGCLAVIEKAEPEQQAAFLMILDSIRRR